MQDPNLFLGKLLLALGGVGITIGLAALLFPAACRNALVAFPRSKWPGWILTAICIFWVTWVVRHAALGRFEPLKPLVPLVGVITFGLVVWLLDELLAPRALGGLLLLLANPLLMGIRWADSPWRYLPVVIAYAWVLIGAVWILHPWLFRRMLAPWVASCARMRLGGALKLLGGLILLAAGWSVRQGLVP